MKKSKIVNSVIRHTSADGLPWQFDMTSEFADKVCEQIACDCADEFLGNHLYRAKYKQNKQLPDGQELDIFGVTWSKSPEGGDVGIITNHPLKEASFSGYEFPEIREDFASSLCNILESKKDDRFTMFSITMGFFERAWSLRGMEPLMLDMMMDESFTIDLFRMIEEHHLALLDNVLDRDFDAVYFGDDWGQQRGLIMGPPMWRKYIKPSMKRIFDKVKSKGKKIVLHSCGDLQDIFQEVIEIGVDVYNTLQPEIYDLSKMKQEYGKDITFYGGISTQQFLPFATPLEVYNKASEVRDILGSGGGYILAPTHAITRDIPVENIMAMLKVAKGETF